MRRIGKDLIYTPLTQSKLVLLIAVLMGIGAGPVAAITREEVTRDLGVAWGVAIALSVVIGFWSSIGIYTAILNWQKDLTQSIVREFEETSSLSLDQDGPDEETEETRSESHRLSVWFAFSLMWSIAFLVHEGLRFISQVPLRTEPQAMLFYSLGLTLLLAIADIGSWWRLYYQCKCLMHTMKSQDTPTPPIRDLQVSLHHRQHIVARGNHIM